MDNQITFNIIKDADNKMIKKLATEAVADGEFLNWDHAYESLSENFEQYPDLF